jgi:hypothetical protein
MLLLHPEAVFLYLEVSNSIRHVGVKAIVDSGRSTSKQSFFPHYFFLYAQ